MSWTIGCIENIRGKDHKHGQEVKKLLVPKPEIFGIHSTRYEAMKSCVEISLVLDAWEVKKDDPKWVKRMWTSARDHLYYRTVKISE